MNNYSSDPINPGVNTPYGNQKSGNGAAKAIIIVVLLIFFVLPLIIFICIMIFASSLVKTIASEGMSISGSDIISSDAVAMQSLEAFQLSARYPRFRNAGLVTHEDCEAVSNAVIRLDASRITGPARWFGNGFCEEEKIKVYSESYNISEEANMPKVEINGIDIDFDTIMASVLSFSDDTRCASFVLSAEGILDYRLEDLSDSRFCKEGGVAIKLGDDSAYEAPEEEATPSKGDEKLELKTKSNKIPQLSI